MSGTGRHRYPGPESFGDTDLDRALIQGRASEGNRLLHLTLAEDIVVLYAKSGTGKTSLINTKLLQPLRERQFLPVVARVGDERFTPAEAIYDAVRATALRHDHELHDGDRASLVAYFRTLEVWNADVLLTPVVILDQFEELFTVRTAAARDAFARELAALRGRLDPAPGTTGPDDRPIPVKLVLSLREDSIGELEELAVSMPDVLRHRFRIGPLSEEEARAAIVEPARLVAPSLATPPFEWAEQTVERLIGFLHQRRRAGRVYTSSHVEPFQLQLICRHVEELVAKRSGEGHELEPIDYDKDIGGDDGAQRIMRGFYERQIETLGRTYPIERLRRLCEEGLVTAAGRRAILDEGTIVDKYGLDQQSLEALSECHLIRVEPRGDEKRYELSHDTLVAPIVEVREARRARRQRRMLASAVVLTLTLGVTGLLLSRTDLFQEWQALREGRAVAAELRGVDTVISAWSLALAWAGESEMALAAAETIEQPPTRTVALTRMSRALAAVNEAGNRAVVRETLPRAIGIANRIQDPTERAQRLVDLGTTAEALKLDDVAQQAWSGVGGDSRPETWEPIVTEAERRRAAGTPRTLGLDAALGRLTDHAVDGLRAEATDPGPVHDRLEQMAITAFSLLRFAPSADVVRLSNAIDGILVRFPWDRRLEGALALAVFLVDRSLLDAALPIIDRVERQLSSAAADDRYATVALAQLARVLDRSGQPARAARAVRRLVATAGREPGRSDPGSLIQARRILSGDIGPNLDARAEGGDERAVSPALLDGAAALRRLIGGLFSGTRSRNGMWRPGVRAFLVSDLVGAGEADAARALITQMASDPDTAKEELIQGYWSLGDREAAVRTVQSLGPDLQAQEFLALATLAKEDGRSLLERGLEAVRGTQDPQRRGGALAAAVDWLARFAPEEIDRALQLVASESHPLVREPMLQALMTAANNPDLAEPVARLVVRLQAPVGGRPGGDTGAVFESQNAGDTPSTASVQGAGAAGVLRDALDRERLVRLRLIEVALTKRARVQGGGLIEDAFAVARAGARQLEGSARAEWLGRLGVVAAQGGSFAEARRLAAESGDAQRRLTVLTAIVAVRAARRAGSVADRIEAEVLSGLTTGIGGGGW